jgi:hypothetical protein
VLVLRAAATDIEEANAACFIVRDHNGHALALIEPC